ncbi:MAG: tetratricopeptide repeat protein, partial [Planctomycetes bacterium]|nr:tetratricopeptide repeat protein [Planctomycetota bacterium]
PTPPVPAVAGKRPRVTNLHWTVAGGVGFALLLGLGGLLLFRDQEPPPSEAPPEVHSHSRAEALLESGDLDEAINEITGPLATDPACAVCNRHLKAAYVARGRLRLEKGQVPEGIGDLDLALRLDPEDVELLVERGLAREMAGNREGAYSDYSAALQRDPKRVDASFHRGRLAVEDRKFAGAIVDLERVLARATSDWSRRAEATKLLVEARYAEGIAAAQTGALDEAIGHFTRAIELDPDHGGALQKRGEIWVKKGDHARAVTDFTDALAKLPPKAHEREGLLDKRASSYLAMGNEDDAMTDIEEGLRLFPESQGLDRLLKDVIDKRAKKVRGRMLRSVVCIAILADSGDGQGVVWHRHGSGFIISASGQILTNAHVVALKNDDGTWTRFDALSIPLRAEWEPETGLPSCDLRILKYGDPENRDLALLQIEGGGTFDPCELGFEVNRGDDVVALAFPGGGPLTTEFGIVSAFDPDPGSGLRIAARMGSGSSGGAIYHLRSGKVVGVIVSVQVLPAGDSQNQAIHMQRAVDWRLIPRPAGR